MKIKSQEFSELDIGGRETCNLFTPRVSSQLISPGPISRYSRCPHLANFQNINQNLNNIIHSALCVSLDRMDDRS